MARPEESDSPYSRGYTLYVLGVALCVMIFNNVDRTILGILVEPIKADLGLTDTQVGLTSDALEPRFGTGALRYALMITLVANLWSAAHFLRAGRTLRSELGSTA